jgi:hypothetical protein
MRLLLSGCRTLLQTGPQGAPQKAAAAAAATVQVQKNNRMHLALTTVGWLLAKPRLLWL